MLFHYFHFQLYLAVAILISSVIAVVGMFLIKMRIKRGAEAKGPGNVMCILGVALDAVLVILGMVVDVKNIGELSFFTTVNAIAVAAVVFCVVVYVKTVRS